MSVRTNICQGQLPMVVAGLFRVAQRAPPGLVGLQVPGSHIAQPLRLCMLHQVAPKSLAVPLFDRPQVKAKRVDQSDMKDRAKIVRT